jgi:hypothetical protein
MQKMTRKRMVMDGSIWVLILNMPSTCEVFKSSNAKHYSNPSEARRALPGQPPQANQRATAVAKCPAQGEAQNGHDHVDYWGLM